MAKTDKTASGCLRKRRETAPSVGDISVGWYRFTWFSQLSALPSKVPKEATWSYSWCDFKPNRCARFRQNSTTYYITTGLGTVIFEVFIILTTHSCKLNLGGRA